MNGWQPLIVCGAKSGVAAHECTFVDLISLTKVVMNDITFVATILTVIVCIAIGFKLMTSGGDTGARKAAKEMAIKVLTGYVFILAAWVIVYTITNALLDTGFSLLESTK